MLRGLKATLGVGAMLCAVVMLPVLGLAGLYSLKFGECVRLPNGTEIGYEAYIDFSRPFFKPLAVLREPNGNVIGEEIWPLHITEKAAYGSAWDKYENPEADFNFIWTAETGVIKEGKDPELYKKLWNDLGEVYYGADEDLNANTLWLFKQLSKNERFRSDDCQTSLATW